MSWHPASDAEVVGNVDVDADDPLTLLQRPVTVLVVRALELRSEPRRLSVGHLGDRPGLGGDDPRLLALDLADTQAGVLRLLQDLGAVSEWSERYSYQ
jgi:hypothetical protein